MKENKLKVLKAKFLRLIGVTKLIPLSNQEKKWIKLFKFHYKDVYPSKGEWTETMKPLFNEIYGWDADEFYNDYLNCMFSKLLELHRKVAEEYHYERELEEVFKYSFAPYLHINQSKPIERAIARLCGCIGNTRYLKDGVPRYSLELKELEASTITIKK